LARILESDKAENFGPSGRLEVCFACSLPLGCGLDIGVSFEINEDELTSTFGSAISAFCKLPSAT
jgi:hypothetical protein